MGKRIRILAMGGTIAGSAADSAATTGYQAGAVGVAELLAAVPQVRAVAEVSGEQLAAIDSKDITAAVQLQMVRRVRELLLTADVDGIVITHGTDTLEESAYLLDLVHFADKPVVITGAMRPSTALSADGPLNLLDAVRVAADDK
ncbi:MAG: asparaginase, partial [Selenomonas sp.]|nr:asparaginase [Selenomonas sp.]